MVYTGIVADPTYFLHQTGLGHPECPARYRVIEKALGQSELLTDESLLTPRSATREELLLCHTASHIDLVEQEVAALAPNTTRLLSSGDVVISPDSWQVALLAAGGVLVAVDAVMEEQVKTAFCAVRPPGHHATRSKGMGFCLFNNVAIGARYAQQQYGIERVLIVDWDVHHGNGTEEIFTGDPSVFYFSTHQHPLYPFTGTASGGNILNCPIPQGEGWRVLEAFKQQLIPAMKAFRPELIFISAGFDAHQLDPLGDLGLSDNDYATLTTLVMRLAKTYAKERVISVLEGGYSLEALTRVVPIHVEHLMAE